MTTLVAATETPYKHMQRLQGELKQAQRDAINEWLKALNHALSEGATIQFTEQWPGIKELERQLQEPLMNAIKNTQAILERDGGS